MTRVGPPTEEYRKMNRPLSNPISICCQAKVVIAEQTEKDIDVTRSQYIPVAIRTQILFFCTSDLVSTLSKQCVLQNYHILQTNIGSAYFLSLIPTLTQCISSLQANIDPVYFISLRPTLTQCISSLQANIDPLYFISLRPTLA